MLVHCCALPSPQNTALYVATLNVGGKNGGKNGVTPKVGGKNGATNVGGKNGGKNGVVPEQPALSQLGSVAPVSSTPEFTQRFVEYVLIEDVPPGA